MPQYVYCVDANDPGLFFSFDTIEAATTHVGRRYAWTSPVLSASYTVGNCDETCDAWSVYPTQAACDADLEGAHAPRIVRREAVTIDCTGDDEDGSCDNCGGSGGGPDVALYCRACGGSGYARGV